MLYLSEVKGQKYLSFPSRPLISSTYVSYEVKSKYSNFISSEKYSEDFLEPEGTFTLFNDDKETSVTI